MNNKLYVATTKWHQDYSELLEFMQPFIHEYERIVLESSAYKEAKEVIERIKNGNHC